MDTKFAITTLISLVFLVIAFLTYRLTKKDKENKKLKEDTRVIHNTTNIIIQSNIYSTLPEDIQEKLRFINSTTASTLQIDSIGGEPDKEKDKEK
ncbi:MAG: hypothetical protein ABH954_04150 [Candidatus Omnitrophota bacterium]